MHRLTVFGATGGSGRELVLQALAAGHHVTALVRRPDSLGVDHPRLRVHQGDATRPGDVSAAIVGSDVVLSALGVHRRGPTTLCSGAVRHMLAAMATHGVRRIGCVSASGLGDGAHHPWPARLFLRYILQPLLREPFADLLRMEAILKASQLDWTIYRPPRLTLGEATGRQRVAIGRPLPSPLTISRADLAASMLAQIDEPATYRTTVELAY